MIKSFALVFALCACFAAHAESGAPFRTEENIELRPRRQNPFAASMMADAYVGTLFREQGTVASLRRLHLYEAAKAPVTLTPAFCEAFTREILYMLPQFPMKIEKTEIFKARFGNACEVIVTDADPETRLRQVVISWVNRKAYAFIATIPKDAARGQDGELRQFVTSLR